MHRTATPIPGSKNYREIVKIDGDVTRDFLVVELNKVIGGQAPSMRSNPRYVRTVRRYRAAIAAR